MIQKQDFWLKPVECFNQNEEKPGVLIKPPSDQFDLSFTDDFRDISIKPTRKIIAGILFSSKNDKIRSIFIGST